MKVEVVRSPKRKKTVQARQIGDTLRISIPAWMSTEDEHRWVRDMVKKMERKASTERFDLARRAEMLATRYQLRRPESIVWVDNQEWRWGSCTPADRSIRISSRLGREPSWVVDYVIVHELAHLSVRGHGPAFWRLVERYPLTERARGFLIARGTEPDDHGEEPIPLVADQESEHLPPSRWELPRPGQAEPTPLLFHPDRLFA